MKFSFYGRVSTEDQQDPASSKQWQLARAESHPARRRRHRRRVLRHRAEPVAAMEASTAGDARFSSRSQTPRPWLRRRRDRRAGPCLLRQPVRLDLSACSSHYGVELWVPEVGGRVDPGSEAHDLVMSLYGGMCKGERNRIKIRVRSAMAAQAQARGPVPRRAAAVRLPAGRRRRSPQPVQGGARTAAPSARSRPDCSAHVGQDLRGVHRGPRVYFAIAEGLTRDGIPSPSAARPGHGTVTVTCRSWSKIAVRSILQNPRYTGPPGVEPTAARRGAARRRGRGAGYQSRMRWNDRATWIWSAEQTHEAIIDSETFAAAQAQMAAGSTARRPSKTTTTGRTYVPERPGALRRLRSADAGQPQPRSRTTTAAGSPASTRPPPGMEHPQHGLRQGGGHRAGARRVDRQLCSTRRTSTRPARHWPRRRRRRSDADQARVEAAQRKLADCDRRLAKYRKALDAGADPVVVAGWIAEVQGERLQAEHAIWLHAQPSGKFTSSQVRALVDGLNAQSLRSLAERRPEAEGERLRGTRASRVTYDPSTRIVDSSRSRPQIACATVRVGGGT